MPTAYLALLRGINVGGNKLVPMAELRALASKLGYMQVQTFIQSGNLLFSSADAANTVEAALEQGIEKRFGFSVPIILRTKKQWEKYAKGSPFAEAEAQRPNLLHLGLCKRPLQAGAEAAMQAYAKAGEQISCGKDAVWIDFNAGVAKSKLTPAVLDRAAGAPITARNWRTVTKLAEMLAAMT